jgi:predicted dienelactone hydrolase
LITKRVRLYVYLLLLLTVLSGCGSASSGSARKGEYEIIHKSFQFNDIQRNNRHITAEIFYPDGLEQSAPLILFAHGYEQLFSDYRYLYEVLVPKGFTVAFVTTQGGVTIDIDTYADDIVSLVKALPQVKKLALMGHSTGGGAIYLASKKLPQTTTVVSLAALGELYGPIYGTSPISIAQDITMPTLILSGSKDCITPPSIHQQPLYDEIPSQKSMVTINGGDHCGFTNSLTCSTAEALSCAIIFQGTTIQEKDQRLLTVELLIPWLEYFLQDKSGSWDDFLTLEKNPLLEYTTQ